MKLKHWIVSLCAMIGLVSTPLFAQQPTETTDIREVKARYCNDPENTDAKSLFIDAKIDEKSVICIDFINMSTNPANIGINFVDGTITNDASQNKACLPEGEKTNFGQYVSNYPESLSIPGDSVKRIFVDLLYSGGYAGASYGCLTFHSLDSIDVQTDEKNMFQVFSRVGSFIDAFVEGDFIIKLISSPIESQLYKNITNNSNFIIYRVSDKWGEILSNDFWTYKTQRNTTNVGNIAVTGHVDISITNRYILHNTISLPNQISTPSQTRSFGRTIPWYIVILGGPTRITGTISYEPIYLGSYAEQASKDTFTLTETTEYFFFPWIIIPLLIYLLWKGYHRKLEKQGKKSTTTKTTKNNNTSTIENHINTPEEIKPIKKKSIPRTTKKPSTTIRKKSTTSTATTQKTIRTSASLIPTPKKPPIKS